DIFNYFSNTEISRLRFGIGNNFLSGGQSDYVLSNFSQSEFSIIIDFCNKNL
ncbi:MAG: aminoacyl-tRNA hydrolase, partial [Mycoplasmataceae bacterium]|nr:aminoacyl-tRNA hydrolase [Mycoplasmataceae bacterium]